jgi:hypothetical protein
MRHLDVGVRKTPIAAEQPVIPRTNPQLTYAEFALHLYRRRRIIDSIRRQDQAETLPNPYQSPAHLELPRSVRNLGLGRRR